MTGFGAVAFRALIALVHNATYNGRLSFVYDANIPEAPSRFGGWVFFSPIIGGLIVVYLVRQFAPEAKGHGVPEVMDAVFYKRSNIRGLVARCPHQGALASAISISSGAVGREGPIIQIGSALGSAFAQVIRLSTWQKIALLSAGAGAGIAATFNTARWRAVCARNSAAGSLQPDLPSRRRRNRSRHHDWTGADRPRSGVRGPRTFSSRWAGTFQVQ